MNNKFGLDGDHGMKLLAADKKEAALESSEAEASKAIWWQIKDEELARDFIEGFETEHRLASIVRMVAETEHAIEKIKDGSANGLETATSVFKAIGDCYQSVVLLVDRMVQQEARRYAEEAMEAR